MSAAQEKGFNLTVLATELKNQYAHQQAAATMQKCHANCLVSLDEDKMLVHEEACFRNCFVKSAQFNQHFEREIKYTLRQFDRPTRWNEKY